MKTSLFAWPKYEHGFLPHCFRDRINFTGLISCYKTALLVSGCGSSFPLIEWCGSFSPSIEQCGFSSPLIKQYGPSAPPTKQCGFSSPPIEWCRSSAPSMEWWRSSFVTLTSTILREISPIVVPFAVMNFPLHSNRHLIWKIYMKKEQEIVTPI